MNQEKSRLDSIAGDSWYAMGANGASVRYSASVFARFFRSGSCLEMGPAEGLGTELLVKHFTDLTCVDGAQSFCEALRARYPNIAVKQSLFEEFEPGRMFDNIVLGHVLEHVEDPRALLTSAREWLTPTGRVLAAVPNARSIHRQMAVEMGLLKHEHELNATDVHHGHRRVYDPESYRQDFLAAGLKIEVFGGYWVKPMSNKQIDEQWTPEMLHAAMVVGERYPDTAAEIYVVAGR